MKKNLFIALLLSFFLGACGGESAKCDNKVALEILEGLFKKDASVLNIGGRREDISSDARAEANEYARKNTKVEFSNFRTEAKDEFSCLCVAKMKITAPPVPAAFKDKKNVVYAFGPFGAVSIKPNSMKEFDNIRYSIRLTDDKKQVYAGFN